MACNCASSEQIKELYKKYGDNRDVKKMTVSERIKYYAQYAGVYAVMILLIPFIFLYVLYKGAFDDDHKISFKKFFNLKTVNVEQ